MIHLFIDTNRYLSLFALDKSELEDIRIIKKYIDDKKITLWLPEQVKNEVIRDIESEILMPKFNKKFKKIKLLNENNNSKLPKLPEYESEMKAIDKILKEETSKINYIIKK